MITTEGLLEAYYDCRRQKRKTASAIMFEVDYESRLIDLRNRINAHTYSPNKSICFVVTRPKYREVFAAAFEDRIVHHWIALRLEPLFESVFSPRTFNCRKGKGQLYGVNMLRSDIIECSKNYTQDCWIMKLDLRSFFMSINKTILRDMLDEFILQYYKGNDIEDVRYLSKVVIMHRPELNCERHSPRNFWDYLPKSKSLFTNGDGLGLAIGNLPSQLFANFLLNSLDWFLITDLGFKYIGRYVDDFYIIDNDKQKLLNAVPQIRNFLYIYGLQLSEKKFYLQHYTKSVEFTGTIVRVNRTYTANRTIKNAVMAIHRLNNATNLTEIRHCIDSVNSYFGCLRKCNEYAMRYKLVKMIDPKCYKYIYIKGHFEVIALKNKYKTRFRTLQRIRDGTY